MSRVLTKTVLAGGVVYPAGGTVPDEVAESITADVFEPVKGEGAQEQKPAPKRAAKKSGS